MEFYSFLLFSLLFVISTNGLVQLTKGLFKRRKLPPGPKGLPIIGNLLSLGDRPHESLSTLAKKHGPLMTVQLGFNTTVVASSAEMAREILQKHDQAFLGRSIPVAVTAGTDYQSSMPWLQGNSSEWRNLRKLCNSHIFTTQRLDALQELRHEMMDSMVRRVIEASEAGEPIYIGRLVFGTTLNLISNTMFSVDIMDPKSNTTKELQELIARALELSGKPNLADFFPFLKPFDPQGIKRGVGACFRRLHELLDEVVHQRLKRRESGFPKSDDFLDILLDHSQEHGPDQFTLQDVKVLLLDLFVGGTDTTTTAMEWAMAELLRNPSIMARAKQELSKTIGFGETIKEKDISQLPYLQSILKETMRLHPVAPILLHGAQADVEICGYTIPKHTRVLVNEWAIFQDPAYWQNPTHFLPERFMGSAEQLDYRGTNFSFIPFGSGRRICPGLALGVRMLTLLLGSLLHHFDWKLPRGITPQDMDMKDKFGILLQKATPLVVIPQVIAIA